MKITDQQKDQLHKKNLANIVRKLNDGKTLTAREQKIIDEASGDDEESDSPQAEESRHNKKPREQYMRAYGVDANAISRWIKKGWNLDDPRGTYALIDAQKRRSLDMRTMRECMAILNGDDLEKTERLLAELDKDNQSERGTKVFWEIENLREKNATLKKERELLEGSMVLRADVVQWMNETLEIVRSSFGETSIAFAEANSGKDVPQLLAAIKRRDEDSFMAARNHLLNLTEQ